MTTMQAPVAVIPDEPFPVDDPGDIQWISAVLRDGGPVERLPLADVLDTMSRRILELQDRVAVAEDRIVLRDQVLERIGERLERLLKHQDAAAAPAYDDGPTGMYL